MSGFAALLVAAAAFAQGDTAVSDELAHLEDFANDETAFVDAARRFDRQQQVLIEWDRDMIEDYAERSLNSLVAAKRDDIRRRADLIGEAWRVVVDRYPKNARAHNYYGEYLYDLAGSEEKALQQWSLALKLDEDLSDVRNNLGMHFFHIGRARLGLEHLRKAIELEPKNPDYLYNLAQMYLIYFPDIERILDMSREKVYVEAMRLSKNAAKYAPDDYDILQDYAVNFFAGENFGINADWPEAARAWEAARVRAPDAASEFYTWLNEARAWVRAEDWEKAEARLTRALELRPQSKTAAELLEQVREQRSGD